MKHRLPLVALEHSQVSAPEKRHIKDAYRFTGFTPLARLERLPNNTSHSESWAVTLRRRGKKDIVRGLRFCLQELVIGRKNWLFAGNDESAKRAAVFCGIIASCKLQNIDPKKYFEAFMKYIASNPEEINASDLMPGKLAI